MGNTRLDAGLWPLVSAPLAAGSFGRSSEQAGEQDAGRALEFAQKRAEATSLRLLAERECPEDIKEWGRSHRIENFAEVTWMNGFEAGMRVAMLAKADGGRR